MRSIDFKKIVLKLSLYGILRLMLPLLPKASLDYTYIVYLIGVITIIYASMSQLVPFYFLNLVNSVFVLHIALSTLGVITTIFCIRFFCRSYTDKNSSMYITQNNLGNNDMMFIICKSILQVSNITIFLHILFRLVFITLIIIATLVFSLTYPEFLLIRLILVWFVLLTLKVVFRNEISLFYHNTYYTFSLGKNSLEYLKVRTLAISLISKFVFLVVISMLWIGLYVNTCEILFWDIFLFLLSMPSINNVYMNPIEGTKNSTGLSDMYPPQTGSNPLPPRPDFTFLPAQEDDTKNPTSESHKSLKRKFTLDDGNEELDNNLARKRPFLNSKAKNLQGDKSPRVTSTLEFRPVHSVAFGEQIRLVNKELSSNDYIRHVNYCNNIPNVPQPLHSFNHLSRWPASDSKYTQYMLLNDVRLVKNQEAMAERYANMNPNIIHLFRFHSEMAKKQFSALHVLWQNYLYTIDKESFSQSDLIPSLNDLLNAVATTPLSDLSLRDQIALMNYWGDSNGIHPRLEGAKNEFAGEAGYMLVLYTNMEKYFPRIPYAILGMPRFDPSVYHRHFWVSLSLERRKAIISEVLRERYMQTEIYQALGDDPHGIKFKAFTVWKEKVK